MDSSWAQQRKIAINLTSLVTGLGIASVTGLGSVMAVTNPSQAAYEAYVTQEMVTFLDQNVCAEAPKAFDLRRDCKLMLKTNRSQIKQFIADGTQRHNYVFFSVYTTDLAVASFLPTYQVETIGAFRQFHVYDTDTE